MAKIDVECLQCKGEGEVFNMFGETSTCKNCKGAGIVIAKSRRFIPPPIVKGYVETLRNPIRADNAKDRIVLVTFKDGKDSSIWFCGTEDRANYHRENFEKEKVQVEQMTPNEYYEKDYAQFHYLPHIKLVNNDK